MKKSISRILIIIIFVIFIMSAFIYYFYRESSFSEKYFIKSDIPKPSIETKNLYQDSKVVENISESQTDVTQYLIIKVKDKWHEVANQKQFTSNLVILGVKNNLLYFSDDEGIKYVDLTDDKYEPSKYFDFKAIECENSINQGFIYNDSIYMSISTSCNNSKFVSFNLNNRKMKTLIKNIGTNFYEHNGDVYYLDYNGDVCKNTKFLKYNIDDNNNSTIDKDICFFKGNKDSILLSKLADSFDKYSVYLYDLNSSDKKYIDVGVPFDIYETTLYYSNDNKIIKYNNGDKYTLYNESNGFFEGLKVINDNELIISSSDGEKYFIDNKIVSEDVFRSKVDSYATIMKDGSVKDFSSIDIVS